MLSHIFTTSCGEADMGGPIRAGMKSRMLHHVVSPGLVVRIYPPILASRART